MCRALKAPGWQKAWHVGVRVVSTGRLVAFISAIPSRFRVRAAEMASVEVNFLCVHKKLRAKRLAPVLIKEVTRRVNLAGVFQALYTAGTLLPEPVVTTQYFHRPLNYPKLCEAGFTALPPGCTAAQMRERLRLGKPRAALRALEARDVPAAHALFARCMGGFALVPLLSLEEFAHWLLPRDRLVYSYVVEGADGGVTDFVSFYALPTSVLGNSQHASINVAYLFYYGAADPATLEATMQAVLCKAQAEGFDVFNCVDIMHNQLFLKSLGFSMGDGSLHYYLYNWKTSLMKPEEVAVVML